MKFVHENESKKCLDGITETYLVKQLFIFKVILPFRQQLAMLVIIIFPGNQTTRWNFCNIQKLYGCVEIIQKTLSICIKICVKHLS